MREKVEILGAKVDKIDMAGAVDFVAAAIREADATGGVPQKGKARQIITLNAEIIYRALTEPNLLQVINAADLVTPDGAGVMWAARQLGQPLPERVTGIDLLQQLIKVAGSQEQNWRFFLFGGQPGVAEMAAKNILQKYPRMSIVGTNHGYLQSPAEERQLLAQIAQARPHILLVALGAPKQEFWISRHKDLLGVPVSIGVGGSLDVLAGKVARAPEVMQRLQLEWLYRLFQEPRRFGRMLALPKFMLRVLAEKGKFKGKQ